MHLRNPLFFVLFYKYKQKKIIFFLASDFRVPGINIYPRTEPYKISCFSIVPHVPNRNWYATLLQPVTIPGSVGIYGLYPHQVVGRARGEHIIL